MKYEKLALQKTIHSQAAIKEKGRQFYEILEEMHNGFVIDLIVEGNFISYVMGMDVTLKGMCGIQMDEVAWNKVKNGIIISEQFFF